MNLFNNQSYKSISSHPLQRLNRSTGRLPGLVAALIAPALLAGAVAGAPYGPRDDGEVVERLPLKAGDPVSRELRRLRDQHAADPRDLDKALRLARRYFDLAMAEGDPRYVGYADAVLRPWTAQPVPPPAILYMRALLRQYRHEFGAAMADLDSVLARDPENANALNWRIALHLVQADYANARVDCARGRHRLETFRHRLPRGARCNHRQGSH